MNLCENVVSQLSLTPRTKFEERAKMSGFDNDGLSERGRFSFASVEELDPSFIDGYKLLYDCEVPLEVRSQTDENDVSSEGVLELIKVKVLILGEPQLPQTVRLELSSEADLFFHYVHSIDDQMFARLQDRQKLMVDFGDYAQEVLIRMIRRCINEPQTTLGVFTMYSASEARLDFLQNLEYKFVELFTVSFDRSDDVTVQNHITYRYNVIKKMMLHAQSQLQEVTNLVKIKNPSLLLQLKQQQLVGGANKMQTGSTAFTADGGSVPYSPSRHSRVSRRDFGHDDSHTLSQAEDTSPIKHATCTPHSVYLGDI